MSKGLHGKLSKKRAKQEPIAASMALEQRSAAATDSSAHRSAAKASGPHEPKDIRVEREYVLTNEPKLSREVVRATHVRELEDDPTILAHPWTKANTSRKP